MRTPGLPDVGQATGRDREPADPPGTAEGVPEAVLRAVPGGAVAAILSSCNVLLTCALPRVTRNLRRRRDRTHSSVWQTEGYVFPSIGDRESDQRPALEKAFASTGGKKREAEGPAEISLSGTLPA